VRRDLRCSNILSIVRAIEQNRGSKVFVQSHGRSPLMKLATASGVVYVLLEVEDFYGRLYASHVARPDPENEDAQATFTRHFTEDMPEVSVGEIEIALEQLKNGKAPGEGGVTTELLKAEDKPALKELQKPFSTVLFERRTPEA
jgi:hypothetical protein